MSTRANAISGKKSAIATNALMMNMPEVPETEVTEELVSSVKLSNEAYIVTNGQTNPLDFCMMVDKESVLLHEKKASHVANAASQRLRSTSLPV